MLIRLLLYITGFILLSSGFLHSMIFLNLIPSGNSTIEYITYLFSHSETYGIPAGALLIHLSTLKKSGSSRT
ncbi:hypothetical protein JMA_14080 [Jeotgalibacillus malaysiensis]|uniref:Uncharacterized protein n=1 Tax=Jeotgalibacillus malaysiensis TaxID=1508404 RepID=A0A0B5AK44_9BACL|nr:hypothetical protein JMA_14080 [Jeotgalibacillus malaysiensis]